jgi:hypothetical protein
MLSKAILLASMLMLMTVCPLCIAETGTIVSVDPKESSVKVGQTFTVNVNITNVSELMGFDFCLSYDSAILQFAKLEEGSFLRGVGSTFMINLTTKGLVWMALVLYHPNGLTISANGTGILATITFKALTVGESLLDLQSKNPYTPDSIKLAKDPPGTVLPIANVAVDGRVVVSPNSGLTSTPPDEPLSNPQAEKSPDLDGDGKINIHDVAIAGRAFGSYPADPRWDSRADLNNDEKVDINDVSKIAVRFGISL